MWKPGHNGYRSYWSEDSGCMVCWKSEDGWELFDYDGIVWRGTLTECQSTANRLLCSEMNREISLI